MTNEQRFKKIVERYDKWLKKYIEAADEGEWQKASYYAFMLNAITGEVAKSSSRELRKYFYQNSPAGNFARIRVTSPI